MARFEALTAVAAPLVLDNIDTDQIFPARFSKKDRRDGNFAEYFLHDHRFSENGEKRDEFILNDRRLHDIKILVAGANYACGSGRPGAIFSHIDYGIRVIIAESFGGVFLSVAYKAGLLAVQLSKDDVNHLQDELLKDIGLEVTIDLLRQVVVAPDGRPFPFEMDPFVKRMIMNGVNEVEFTLGLEAQIKEFETQQAGRLPWVFSHG